MQRLTVLGRRRDIGIGSALTLTPAAARKIALKNSIIAKSGRNPLDQSVDGRSPAHAPRVMTLAQFSLTHWRRKKATGTRVTEARRDYNLIKTHVTPVLGRRPVAEITAQEIRSVLEILHKDSAANAQAVRSRLKQLFDAVVDERLRPDNPARMTEAAPAGRRTRITSEGDARNERIFRLLPPYLRELTESPRRPTVLRLVRFNVLSVRSPMECREAKWDQVNLEDRIWRFPRMQRENAKMIEVYLHDDLLKILKEMTPLRRGDGEGWVFPNSLDFDKPFSLHAATHIPTEFGYDLTLKDVPRVFEWRRSVIGGDYGLEDWARELLIKDDSQHPDV